MMICSVVSSQYLRVTNDEQKDGQTELLYLYRALRSFAVLTSDKNLCKKSA